MRKGLGSRASLLLPANNTPQLGAKGEHVSPGKTFPITAATVWLDDALLKPHRCGIWSPNKMAERCLPGGWFTGHLTIAFLPRLSILTWFLFFSVYTDLPFIPF